MNTTKSDKLVVEKFCSMTLRDQAKTNVAINVSKKGYGSCQVLPNGKVFHGRQNQKKNEIELVIPAEKKDKARVEDWQMSVPWTSLPAQQSDPCERPRSVLTHGGRPAYSAAIVPNQPWNRYAGAFVLAGRQPWRATRRTSRGAKCLSP